MDNQSLLPHVEDRTLTEVIMRFMHSEQFYLAHIVRRMGGENALLLPDLVGRGFTPLGLAIK